MNKFKKRNCSKQKKSFYLFHIANIRASCMAIRCFAFILHKISPIFAGGGGERTLLYILEQFIVITLFNSEFQARKYVDNVGKKFSG